MKNGKLEVGDKVAAHQYGAWENVVTIKRLTPTMAVSENHRFVLDVINDGGYVREVGADRWGPSWCLVNEKNEKEILRQRKEGRARDILNAISTTLLSDDKLDWIIENLEKKP